MPTPSDPHQSLSHNFGFLTRIKYGGVLGKITAVAAAFFITLCVLASASRNNPYLLAGIVLVAILSLIFLVYQMKAIFMAHPDLVTLEGKEIIEYRRLELRLKGAQTLVVREIAESPVLPHPDNLLMFPESKERKED